MSSGCFCIFDLFSRCCFFLMCCSELSKATHLCFFLKRRLSAISQMQLQQIPRTAECSLADTFASRVVELQSQDSDAATSWKPYESLRRRCILWVVLFGQNLVFKLRLKLWAHLFQICQSRFDFLLQKLVTLVGLSLKCMKSKVESNPEKRGRRCNPSQEENVTGVCESLTHLELAPNNIWLKVILLQEKIRIWRKHYGLQARPTPWQKS